MASVTTNQGQQHPLDAGQLQKSFEAGAVTKHDLRIASNLKPTDNLGSLKGATVQALQHVVNAANTGAEAVGLENGQIYQQAALLARQVLNSISRVPKAHATQRVSSVRSQSLPLDGKVAVVIGGGGGIGGGIARELAKAGANVVVSYVDTVSSGLQQYGKKEINDGAPARRVAEEIKEMGRRSVALQADVTKAEDTQRLVAQVVKEFGALDILVCSQGAINLGNVEGLTEEAFDIVLNTNLKGTYLMNKAAIQAMKESGGGSIINISSIAGKEGHAGLAAYCASKFAVIGFSRALSKELAADNIRVNTICPGILATQMWTHLSETLAGGPGQGAQDVFQGFVRALIPQNKPQTPEDIGKTAVFLACSPSITGQAYNVDGGAEMH
jgi:meso-butanediol dehydrogenase/(S,S)-butanediol dehydrogenase/diacetyl reductase